VFTRDDLIPIHTGDVTSMLRKIAAVVFGS
jgi:hypothetical protein